MKVLITGGAGYIGTELSFLLASKDEVEEVIIYDNLSRQNYNAFIGLTKYPAGKVRFVEGDILDTRKLRKELKQCDAVIHMAAKVSTPFSDQNPHLFEQINHWGTAELTYAIEELSNIKKFIYLSSVSVYGSGANEFSISTDINPRTFYGISKMRGEEHVARIKDKVPTYILRLGNVYGYSKSMRFDAVINKFMFEANFKRKITINGDGNQVRSFTHIVHTSRTLSAILLRNDLSPDLYNLTEFNLSVNDVVDQIKHLYPDLEMIFVSQHMKLRGLKVAKDERLNVLNIGATDFNESLATFKKEFTF